LRPDELENKHYGSHHKETSIAADGDLNIIAVDPGHCNLISAARVHVARSPIIRGTVVDDLTKRLFHKQRSEFTLTNKTWRIWTGSTGLKLKEQNWQIHHKHKQAYIQLSEATSRVTKRELYVIHTRARLEAYPHTTTRMSSKSIRRLKFITYQKEQRAYKKLASNLVSGLDDSSPRLIVWGGGGFGPTSRGHASAPNKRMQQKLSHYIPILSVLSGEAHSARVAVMPVCST
jgi:hypothetical protein